VVNQKFFFLYALIIAIIVFNIGIYMGYLLENSRIDKINTLYLNSEMELLDQRIQKDASDMINFSCKDLVNENINFADQIYTEALQIEKYENANKLSDAIVTQHKRFDLLRTLFWTNSMRIKQKCNANYHDVVYFYQYNNPTIEQKAKQQFFSNLLFGLKQEKGDKIMLIPIAGDNNISSIDLLEKNFGISELPTILIDESIKITDVNNKSDIEKYLN
jgi:hypothetical protein